jgi:hypothetical protein
MDDVVPYLSSEGIREPNIVQWHRGGNKEAGMKVASFRWRAHMTTARAKASASWKEIQRFLQWITVTKVALEWKPK